MTQLTQLIVDELGKLSGGNLVILTFILAGLATILTTIGSLPVLLVRKHSGSVTHLLDVGLGFSSGVMIVASFTSLLLPAIDLSGVFKPLIGLSLGAISVALVNKAVPHEHLFKGYEGPSSMETKARAAWMVAMAIIIHNLPEGMAIGSAAAYNANLGIATGIAIALQDMPEGFAVALPISLLTGNPWKGVVYGFLSGLSELIVAVPVSIIGVSMFQFLPYLLGFGAGAMVYVVSHEALPESHRTGHERDATLGFFIGFILMLYLDTALG